MQRVVNDADLAEDLAAQTFMQMLEYRDRFIPQSPVSSWIYTIATNVLRDNLRQQSRHQKREQQWWYEVQPAIPNPEKLYIGEELRQKMRSYLAEHAFESIHKTMELRFLEEQTYAEIAQRQQIPRGTVMSRIHRGRKKLQQHRAALEELR